MYLSKHFLHLLQRLPGCTITRLCFTVEYNILVLVFAVITINSIVKKAFLNKV